MGKAQKQGREKGQARISSFFCKLKTTEATVLSDKTNTETSPYFSPEVVVLSDKEPSPQEITPRQSSPGKRKSCDDSSPDVIPATPTRRKPQLSRHKKRLKLSGSETNPSSQTTKTETNSCNARGIIEEIADLNYKATDTKLSERKPVNSMLVSNKEIDIEVKSALETREYMDKLSGTSRSLKPVSETNNCIAKGITELNSEATNMTSQRIIKPVNTKLGSNKETILPDTDMKSAMETKEFVEKFSGTLRSLKPDSETNSSEDLNFRTRNPVEKCVLVDTNSEGNVKDSKASRISSIMSAVLRNSEKGKNNSSELIEEIVDLNSEAIELNNTKLDVNTRKAADRSREARAGGDMEDRMSGDDEISRVKTVEDSTEKKSRDTKTERSSGCVQVDRSTAASCSTKERLTEAAGGWDDWDFSMMEGKGSAGEGALDLEVWQHCEVLELQSGSSWEKLVTLKCTRTAHTASCLVKDFWVETPLAVGDVVSVKARRDGAGWCLDNRAGLLVHHPDTLISSTSVVGSLFCPRRGVLSEWFRGMDGNSRIMVVGSLVHELLQEVLERRLSTETGVRSMVQELLARPDSVQMLFSSRMSTQEAVQELEQFVPRVVMPLELKTGRSSFSAEHKGQVTLYNMMMSQLGRPVDTGLLLYLRDGTMREVSSGSNEWRDLIILRNQLAHYIMRIPGAGRPPELPEPINHHSACSKCPYLTLCSSFLRREGLTKLPASNPLSSLALSATSHLSESHLDYLLHWTGLLLLEDAEPASVALLRDLWCLAPADREKRGKCLSHMVVSGRGESSLVVTLRKSCGDTDLRLSGLAAGEYVVVSSDKRLAVSSGTVRDISYSNVSLSLNKELPRSREDMFHVDSYASQTGKVFNLTNLGCLMDDTDSAAKLRRLVIDKAQPTFIEKLSSSILRPGRKILEPLNMGQRRAVVKALTANDYFLIKGMPGTGKTATIVSLVELLVKLGQSVLVTSHTHSAVDNVLLKLVARGMDFLRLGACSRIHPELQNKSEQHLARHCCSPDQLSALYSSKLVVATTCLGAGHPMLAQRTFDVCIVDESTQVLQASVLRPLFSAAKFILIGDPEQLPPIVRSKRARELGMAESLFARLDSSAATVSLHMQYRMNQAITDVANGLTYQGELKCGNEAVSQATLQLPTRHVVESDVAGESWLGAVVSSDMSSAVVVLDTGDVSGRRKEEQGCTNLCEVAVIHRIVTLLIKGGVPGCSVGIIAPYRAQVALLRKTIPHDTVEVNTVDQYQGRDKDVVIFSCTRSCSTPNNSTKEQEILSDKRRLTVAVTRAKHKLLIVGDVATLRSYVPFKQLFDCLSPDNTVVLSDGERGFSWHNVLSVVSID